MQTAPKYSLIELFGKDDNKLVSHKDCGMFISGELLIVVESTNSSIHNNNVSEGFVYHLKDIARYKTYSV